MMNLAGTILNKAKDGKRINLSEGKTLLMNGNILELGETAFYIRMKKHPQKKVTYIVDRNINYTNICVTDCSFCAFYRNPGHSEGYVLPIEEIIKKVEETVKLGGTGILLQGGHNPAIPFSFYEDMLVEIKKSFPKIHIHAFSPPEIIFFAERFKMPLKEVIGRLIKSGLDSIPGGGAEILSEPVRKKISPNKATSDEWIDVMRTAHNLGLKTTATMMFGHIEEPSDIICHLKKIRDLQDETGGFTAFIPWTYQMGEGTELKEAYATGVDYLRVLSVSRIFLDNFDNIQASWVTQGIKVGQVALFYGANDMGSVMIEENVVASAGCSFKTSEEELRGVIENAGFEPKKRRTLYENCIEQNTLANLPG